MTRFLYGKIRIDTVNDASVVQYGENFQSGFTDTTKMNEGFGSVHGRRNALIHNIQIVSDEDESDVWGSQAWHQREKM